MEMNQWDSKTTVAGRALEAMKYGVNLPLEEDPLPYVVNPRDIHGDLSIPFKDPVLDLGEDVDEV